MKIFWQQCEGQIIDGFPLLQYLGGGEEHAVFLTEFAGDSTRKAAIKLTHADPESTETQLRRWRLAAELSHPHLMSLFERGTWQLDKTPLLYVVTEYADENLSQVIPQRPLTVDEAKEMLEPALSTLDYLHSQGFVHGHLKPSNIMAIDSQLKLSADAVVQIGVGGASPADDVWSLGMTLVEALTQRLPAWGPAEARDPKLPETLPSEFRDIARNALRRDPRSRWTIAGIRQRLTGEPDPVKSPKRFSAAAGSALLLVLLAAVAGTLLIRNREGSPAPESQAPAAVRQSVPAPQTAAPQAVPAPEPVQAPQPAPVAPPPPRTESKVVPARPPKATSGDVVQQVLPDVLPRARNTIHGKVVVKVRVEVDPAGAVSDATLESEGVSAYFAGLAQRAAQRWKFTPADAQRALILRFEFTRGGTKAAVVKAAP